MTTNGDLHCAQVVPRPLQSVLPLQVPVASAEASSAPLEADHLRQGLLLAHLREMQARALCLLGHGTGCAVCGGAAGISTAKSIQADVDHRARCKGSAC